jgi:hypothetical protein
MGTRLQKALQNGIVALVWQAETSQKYGPTYILMNMKCPVPVPFSLPLLYLEATVWNGYEVSEGAPDRHFRAAGRNI